MTTVTVRAASEIGTTMPSMRQRATEPVESRAATQWKSLVGVYCQTFFQGTFGDDSNCFKVATCCAVAGVRGSESEGEAFGVEPSEMTVVVTRAAGLSVAEKSGTCVGGGGSQAREAAPSA